MGYTADVEPGVGARSCVRALDEEVAECSITSWLPVFQNDTIKSVLVDIPAAVVNYLDEGGTVVTSSIESRPAAHQHSDGCEMPDTDSWLDTQPPAKQRPQFEDFDRLLSDALERLGGEAFVKVNWHAPLDARWITAGHSLHVTSVDCIHLLLAASNRLQADIHTAQNLSEQLGRYRETLRPVVVLRQWTDITPCSQLRCFVVNKQLVAVCQRDISQCFPFLYTEKDYIIEVIGSFFSRRIHGKSPLSSYTFDVYCDGLDVASASVSRARCRVVLLDFGVFDESSVDPLLFSWPQLTGVVCLACEAPISSEPTEDAVVELEMLCEQCRMDMTLPVFQSVTDSSRTIVPPPYSTRGRPIDMDPLVGPDTHGAALVEILRASRLRDSDTSSESSESADS